MAEAPLSLSLLGPFEARVNGSPLPRLRSQKGPWLLALLVLRDGREVPRDWLAEALWPESLDALMSLRQSLSDLRRALGAEAPRLRSPSTRTLRLDLAGAEVDVLEFDAAIRRGDSESLDQALTLYRGTLLEGCAEAWVLPEREARQQAYLRALETLATRATADGDHAAAARYLRRGAAVDPLHQTLHRALMRSLAQTAQYQAAIEVYQSLRHHLHREYNAEPDAETTALYQRIRAEARGRARERGSEGASEGRSERARERESERRGWGHMDAGSGSGRPSHSLARSLSRSVPQPLTALIGREKELQAVEARLAAARLVTLTGNGGIGKTRLAVEIASDVAGEYAGGVCFVDLSALSEPGLVPRSVAVAIGLPVPGQASGVRREASEETLARGAVPVILSRSDASRLTPDASPPAPELAALIDFLRPRQILLILDNCEHLIAACAETARTLLTACPSLRILATSREKLGLTGEVVWRVPPLSLPDMQQGSRVEGDRAGPQPLTLDPRPSTLLQSAAVRLFVERAAAVRADFAVTAANVPVLAHICRRLDGIPLAIELAAAHVEALPVEEIAARLEHRFHLLTSGDRTRPERHQTLRAMIDWSYDRMTPEEQALLRGLSVFAGGWALAAATAVCDLGFWISDSGLGAGGSLNNVAQERQDGEFLSRESASSTRSSKIQNPNVLTLLSRLVSKSLVLADASPTTQQHLNTPTPSVRYRLLETIRQYAAEKLVMAADEADGLRGRHLEFYTALAEAAEPGLSGPEQAAWLARLDAEYENMRAALEWAQLAVGSWQLAVGREAQKPSSTMTPRQLPTANRQLPTALRLAGALGRYWQIRGYFTEGREQLMRSVGTGVRR